MRVKAPIFSDPRWRGVEKQQQTSNGKTHLSKFITQKPEIIEGPIQTHD